MQRNVQIEREVLQQTSNPFTFESSNLEGDFEKDLRKVNPPKPVAELILKYKEVFGPLPSPGKGCDLVKMDLQL